ncbi:MAG: hypothetical protein KDA66_10280, partial [Planctomycetaceae bacterium]|nr:hypothetical protein [Planctomycetaceae bacterium]
MKNTSAKLLLASVVLLLNAVGRADVSPSEADTAVWFSEEVDAGKLFLNGQPIQSPVLIEATAAGVFANGVTIPYAAEPTRDDLEEFGEYGDEDEYSGRNRGSRRGNANRSQRELDPSFQATQYARRIRNLLDQSLVVVVFENEPIKPIYTISEQFTLYETLLAEVPTEQQREMFLLLAPKSEYQVTWETWLGEYTPTTVERQEMQAFLDETLASEAAQTRQAQATQRLEMFAYPLTALGMIISVFGFGHLLQWVAKGFADQETAETDT